MAFRLPLAEMGIHFYLSPGCYGVLLGQSFEHLIEANEPPVWVSWCPMPRRRLSSSDASDLSWSRGTGLLLAVTCELIGVALVNPD